MRSEYRPSCDLKVGFRRARLHILCFTEVRDGIAGNLIYRMAIDFDSYAGSRLLLTRDCLWSRSRSGDCLEERGGVVVSASEPVGLVWRKSSACVPSECVEVASDGNAVFVRDSKTLSDLVLRFAHDEWRAFVRRTSASFQPPCRPEQQ